MVAHLVKIIVILVVVTAPGWVFASPADDLFRAVKTYRSIDDVADDASGQSLLLLKSSQMLGQGVLILVDDQLRILTNAHVVQADTDVEAVSATAPEKTFTAHVLWRDAEADLAVLDVGAERAHQPDLIAIAKSALMICSSNADGLCAKQKSDVFGIQDLVVFDGKTSRRTFVDGTVLGTAEKIQDQYVSGLYPYLWSVREVTKGGVSGGRYDQDDRFAGLITKVSLGMQTQTFAIPTEAIASLIAKAQIQPLAAAKTNFIYLAKGGGGDTGNGGDSLLPSADSIWTLMNMCGYQGCFSRPITNPFANAKESSAIDLDGKNVVALEQSNLLQGFLIQAASRARLNWLVAHKVHFQQVEPGSKKLEALFSARRQAAMPIRYIRVWKKSASNTFTNAYPVEGAFHDGTIEFFAGRPTKGYTFLDSVTPPRFRGVTGHQFWLDLLSEDENLRVSIAPDFSQVTLTNADRTNIVKLKALPDNNLMKHVFISDDGTKRAVMIYHEQDLTRLLSVLIETETHLYEFTTREPNMGIR